MQEGDKSEFGPAAKSIPGWMRKKNGSPLFFLDLRGRKANLEDPAVIERISGMLLELQQEASPKSLAGPAIIKVHIGEPMIKTALIPPLVASSVDFLKSKGITGSAFGDTTVLYSGKRGGNENPHGAEKIYLEYARERGWGGLGAPFVILDRPATSVPGAFEFKQGALSLEAGPPGRYSQVFAAGALEAAGTLIQHAHMTGHLLTGLACCIKGIAMGLSNRRGKAQLHLSLQPRFNAEVCDRCGDCAQTCPENAIELSGDNEPGLIAERCLGCGQCLAQCERKAITMKGLDSYAGYDWGRGSNTVVARLADYAVGLMQNLWESSIHVAHMVRMTASCDCLNTHQTPMCEDAGFIVGRNPFAVDRAASEMLMEILGDAADQGMKDRLSITRSGDMPSYLEKTYGISTDAQIKAVPFNM